MDNDSSIVRTRFSRRCHMSQYPKPKRHNQTGLQNGELVRCKRKCTKKTLQECSLVSEKWKHVDPNILGEIFCRVHVVDLFLNVSSVCQSWEAACWDFLFWSRNVLDMSATGAGLGVVDISTVLSLDPVRWNRAWGHSGEIDSPEKDERMATNLMTKLTRIMEGEDIYRGSLDSWRQSVQTVILPYDLEVSDAHLLYIAKRTPCLQQLVLLCTSKITTSGFSKAIQHWKMLKEIHLGSVVDDTFLRFIAEIGRNCQELESLHLHRRGLRVDRNNARTIANSLPGLKKVEFQYGNIAPSAVTTLFKFCLQLEEVYFNFCRLVTDIECRLVTDIECSVDLSSPWPFEFWLTWSVEKDGYAKWEVRLGCVDVESFNKRSNRSIDASFIG